ncbi:hypothetical protein ColTof4_13599 [Colletotrichum tofieldiae]|nr:hypothetical protein ColTof3_14551 [Colletotrichum tofieldiae]GKT81176.1 hypothetical protein ColTof4_13599 [Colletotrichum tofieldiae]GKT97312.1 hypothetical protein Ct61P_15162 [Colletotrichum tofieldiae]
MVRCIWAPVNTRDPAMIPALIEKMAVSKGCWMHKGYKGHPTIGEDTDTYLILCGFASGDEPM